MSAPRRIRRALISVFDKTGVVEFCRALHEEFGIELISTGGTAKVLTEAGLPVTLVEAVTGFPEMMDGRVKTLHPKIHAAILADRDNPEHMRQLAEQGIEPIDMVVVNLYPFEQTIAKPGCTFEEALEMIDIGGPCLLRAAAKNHRHVLVVPSGIGYERALRILRGELEQTREDEDYRLDSAMRVFGETAHYDNAVLAYFGSRTDGDERAVVPWTLWQTAACRYGENPQQDGAHYLIAEQAAHSKHPVLPVLRPLAGTEMSFNNYADASAALELCAELTRASRLWHRSPTGVQYHRSLTCDTQPEQPSQHDYRRPIVDEHCTRRNLPHIQKPGATYFVTFRVRHGQLLPAERDLVLAACRYWHGKKMTLHCTVVMPDHVHVLLSPHERPEAGFVSLSELLKSIKGYSSQELNRARGTSGPVWLDESFDRIVRDEREFIEKWEYMEANPVTAGLVRRPPDYPWFWKSEFGWGELAGTGEVKEDHDRSETCGTSHRSETGATDPGATASIATYPGATDSGAAVVDTHQAVCFIKHTNACGAAVDADPIEAYRRAYLGDPNAAMGGILAVNFAVTAEFAAAVMDTYQRWGKPLRDAGHPNPPGAFFVEVWLAPSFDDAAVEIIRGQVDGKPKKDWGQRVRLLDVGDLSVAPDPNEMDFKRIAGGLLMQTRDLVGLNEEQWQVVTERPPTDAEMSDLRLAWLVCKHTKSNAVTICKDGMLIGNGAGQMSRVMSCRIATWLARENGHAAAGAVAASDAFFPFRDGPDVLADAGVTALIQPGGSKRDAEVIAACNARGLAMVFTGTRHFRH